MSKLDERIKNKKIILFGVGNFENIYREYILEKKGDRVLYFIDNYIRDNYQYNKKVYSVYPVAKILEENIQESFCLIMVQTERIKQEMKEQLEKMGLKEYIHFDYIQNYEEDIIKYKIEKLVVNPKTVVMELSSYCNLSCEFCNFHGFESINKDRKNFLTWEILEELIYQIKKCPSIRRIISYHSGEELLHPQWHEMIQYLLDETNIEEFIISTNGMLLNEKNISKFQELKGKDIKLFVSLSGNSINECEVIRKKIVYNVVKENILNAYQRLSNKIEIRINCDYMITEEYFNSVGRDFNNITFEVPEYIKKDFPMIKCYAGPTYLYNPDKISADLMGFCEPVEVRNKRGFCSNIFDMVSVDSSGYVLNCPCNGGYSRLGNILDEDMFKIWSQNSLMVESRKILKETYKQPQWCENCAFQANGTFHMLIKKKELDSID